MAKSENKKFLIVFAAIFAAIALLCPMSLSVLAKADASADEAAAVAIYNDVKGKYAELRDAGIEIDKDNSELEAEFTRIKNSIQNGDDVTLRLDGEIGLSGIKKIAVAVLDFYNSNIDVTDADKSDAAKRYIKNFSVSAYRDDDYDSEKVSAFLNAFNAPEVSVNDYSKQKAEIEKTYNEYLGDIKANATSDFVARYKDYVYSKLPNINGEKQAALDALDACAKDEDANKIASDFTAKFSDVNTYIQYLDKEIVTKNYDDLHVNKTYADFDAKKKDALEFAKICENVIADANEFYSGDENSKSHLKSMYVNTCRDGIEAIRSGLADNYGPSAYDKITSNREMARNLLDTISGNNGKIGAPYTYIKTTSEGLELIYNAAIIVNVDTGRDVILAFEDSYTVDGALQYNGKKSSTPQPKTSTVKYSGKDVTVTLTAIDALGAEVREFDVDAKLEVRVGTTPTIERNINTLLAKKDLKDRISASIPDRENLAEELAGKHIQYFYTLTVYEGGIVREDFDGKYRITIEYKDDVLTEHVKNGFNVINYYHTEITGVVAENKIETEGKKIMFETDNFAQFALLSDVEWVDLAKWILLGVVGFIVLIWLIVLIVYLVRNRKYTVIFNANGGRPTTHVRLKIKEKFSYPKNPVRRGHVFMGWYTTRKCEIRFASTEMLTKKRLTVYAKWITEEEYKALIAETEEETVPTLPVKEEKPVEKVEPIEEKTEETVETPIEEPNEEPATETAEEPIIIPAIIEEPKAEEPAEETQEEVTTFDVVAKFDDLKSEIFSYEKANDLAFGLELSKPVCSIKVVDEKIELEVALCPDELANKGYKVTAGDRFASRLVIESEEDYAAAEELVEEVMYENGLKKSDKAVITTATENTKEEGFVRTLDCDKVADSAEEYFKLLRVYAKSFVKPDGDKGEDKPLLKMFTLYDRVNLYLNYFVEGMNECDEAIKALGYRSFVVVRDAEECAKAEEYIRAMMKENGLVRFPVDAFVNADGTDKGFSYTLKY